MIPLYPPPERPVRSGSPSGLRKVLLVAGSAVGCALAIFIVYIGVIVATGNFHAVVPGEFYRSAQPSAATIARYQRDQGIRTIINLRGENADEPWYQEEIAAAREFSIRHVDFRVSAKRGLTKKQAWQLIEIMERAPKPLLVHCESGVDRSGLASALYLAAVERAGEAAAEEQLSLRFGHIAASWARGWGMTVTFEEMEPSLGYMDS